MLSQLKSFEGYISLKSVIYMCDILQKMILNYALIYHSFKKVLLSKLI